MSDEEFLRENWDRVEVNYYPECADWGFFTANGLYSLPNQPTRERLYASGAEFTRDRMEEIWLLEWDIHEIETIDDFQIDPTCRERILVRLNRDLAPLKTGMKPSTAQGAKGE